MFPALLPSVARPRLHRPTQLGKQPTEPMTHDRTARVPIRFSGLFSPIVPHPPLSSAVRRDSRGVSARSRSDSRSRHEVTSMPFVQPRPPGASGPEPLRRCCSGPPWSWPSSPGTVPPHASIRSRFEFRSTDVRIEGDGAETRVSMRGANVAGGEDAPGLPMVIRTFYVPEGEEVAEVVIRASRESHLASGVSLRTRTTRALEPADVTRPYPTGALPPNRDAFPRRTAYRWVGDPAPVSWCTPSRSFPCAGIRTRRS